MKSGSTLLAAFVLALATGVAQIPVAAAQQSGMQGQQSGKPQMHGMSGMSGMMGQGGMMGMSGMMGQGGMMGMSGMMGRGGMMGQGGRMHMGGMGRMMKMRKKMMGKMFMTRKKPYSNADIRRIVDGRLATHGFSKLMAGDVTDGPSEANTAVVSVVSPKGELLFKVEVNRKTGMAAIIE